jgi:hypothetical protein
VLTVPPDEGWEDDWSAPSLVDTKLRQKYYQTRKLWGEIVKRYSLDIHVEDGRSGGGAGAVGMLDLPPFVAQIIALAAGSGMTTAVYQLIKVWVDARNGRKLKIKVGEIEVEATQMAESDVLRIIELLQENADRKKIRDMLLKAATTDQQSRE